MCSAHPVSTGPSDDSLVGDRPQTLLGGRVIHRQAYGGHRTGIEPVLLAAAVSVRPGARVLEAGTGTGAGLLCLSWRVAGLSGVGIEDEPATAALARANLAANGREAFTIVETHLPDPGPLTGPFDAVFANPPWHEEHGSACPDARRDLARRARRGLLADWTATLSVLLRHRGSLTYILPGALHAQAIAVLHAAGFGAVTTCPLWPRAGQAARLVLIGGRRGARSPSRILPGLVLHEADGTYTASAQAILRDGAPLTI